MKRLLIADDDPAMRTALARSVDLLGYHASFADGGGAAIRLANENSYDLILLDLKMPDMNGLRALDEIRSLGSNTQTPVIIVSAYSQFENVEKAVDHGADDFLVKPFNSHTLLEHVLRHVNASVERRWERLKPDQEKLLRMTVNTMEGAFDAVRQGRDLPYERMNKIADHIIDVIDKGNIYGVLRALKDHDSHTFVHSLRVGIYLTLFTEALAGFDRDDLMVITTGGVVHDVGKAKTPVEILNKPGELDEREMEIMKKHVIHTVEILQGVHGVPYPVIEIGWRHHERMDGSGYPRGLKGDQIGIFGRMAAIVEEYVGLIDKGTHIPGEPLDEPFEILENTPGGLDANLLQDFKVALQECGFHA